jgi:type IV pilus assembly protein PilB
MHFQQNLSHLRNQTIFSKVKSMHSVPDAANSPRENHIPLKANEFIDVINLLVQNNCISTEQVLYAKRLQSKLESERPLLDILRELKYVSDEDLKMLLRNNRSSMALGGYLVALGYIKETDLNLALKIQSESTPKRKLGEILIERQLIDEKDLLEVLSLQMGIEFIEPDYTKVDIKLFSKAPPKCYQKYHFIPIRTENNETLIAFADPSDNNAQEAARRFFGTNFTAVLANKSALQNVIKQFQHGKPILESHDSGKNIAKTFIDKIIHDAIDRKASDIHIEPFKDKGRIRFRQDGVLVHYDDLPLKTLPVITNRLKVLCNLDIAEKRRHQGGRFLFEYPGGELDLRVSFYVTVHGEKIVLRLLNRKGVLLNLGELGMPGRMLERFKEDALYLPSGVILFTGPTGSGKTTSVYSCINHLNSPKTSIITAEEPVEYVIDGIAQCSINPRIQLTFEETLRHIVRQDPDIIVIGEIRDDFSAEIAVQAALTGHKVLTTFHTEDSIGGLIRLMNMKIEAFLISSTVVSVVAQRLARKICTNCSQPHLPTPVQLRNLGYTAKDISGIKFRAGKGCAACQYTGYQGRVGIYELLILEETIRNAIIERRTSQEIRKLSIESSGLVTLMEDGIIKASDGMTTIDELLRCLPRLQRPRPLAEVRRLVEGSL